MLKLNFFTALFFISLFTASPHAIAQRHVLTGPTTTAPMGKASVDQCRKTNANCLNAYYAYLGGDGVRKSEKRAMEMLEIGCTINSDLVEPEACIKRADLTWSASDRSKQDEAVNLALFGCLTHFKPTIEELNSTESYRIGCNNMLAFIQNRLKGKPAPWPGGFQFWASADGVKDWCEMGYDIACMHAGVLAYWKNEVNTLGDKPVFAASLNHKACNADIYLGCWYYRASLAQMEDVEQAALEMIRAKECRLNNGGNGCDQFGPDLQSASSAQIAAKLGFSGVDPTLPAEEQMLVAEHMLIKGQTSDAVNAFKRLAYEQYAPAFYRLGLLHYRGEAGMPQNNTQAADFFDRSKFPDAHYLAAYLYQQMGDTEQQISQLEKAYFAGHPEATEWSNARTRMRQAESAERSRQTIAQARANEAAEAQMTQNAISRAMNNYGISDGNDKRVCALIIQGGRMTQECMSEETYDKYFKP